ncbi:MAG: hypothetical protein KF762_05970 [Acidobacteria bacterium]|nr:hypothetical protein [Acidobacteriota bacterium]
MTLYIGVDFHPHQQTLSWCDSETGETQTRDLPGDRKRSELFFASRTGDSWHRGASAPGQMVQDML